MLRVSALGRRLPLPEVVRTAACVADALGTAHEEGLTHRDIKPSNIVVRSRGKATAVDFGITKSSDARHDITTAGVLIGTPAYMAPERASGQPGRIGSGATARASSRAASTASVDGRGTAAASVRVAMSTMPVSSTVSTVPSS